MASNRVKWDGLDDFVAARGPALLRLAWLFTADEAAAKDLVQDALVRILPKWDAITPAAREAYLRATIRSAWIDRWRREGRARLSVVPGADLHHLTDEALDDAEIEGLGDRAAMAVALAQLAPGQRAVLVIRFYEDQTEVQTAKALGVSVSTVKSQTREALRRLRRLVPDSPPELTTEVTR